MASDDNQVLDAVVIGAGFAGICLATEQQVRFQSSGAPGYGGRGIRDLVLEVIDAQGAVVARDP